MKAELERDFKPLSRVKFFVFEKSDQDRGEVLVDKQLESFRYVDMEEEQENGAEEEDALTFVNKDKEGPEEMYPINKPFPYLLSTLEEKFETGISETQLRFKV
jgi:hypothetical protein